MTVLFVSRKYPPSIGGMELFASELYSYLSQVASVKLIKFGGPRLLGPFMIPLLWLRAALYLASHKVDVVHVADGMQAPIGVFIARLFRTKVAVVIHGLDFTWPLFFYQALVPPAVKRADAVICISREVRTAVLAKGVPQEKVHFIPLAIADNIYRKISRSEARSRLSLGDDQPLLLSVGRLVKRKGITWFIENVLVGLVKQYPSLVLLLIGEGEEKAAIADLVNSLGLTSHVRLLGQVSGEDLIAAYNASDVFVMPNIPVPGDMEGFGLVLLEAASCALPVVAANIEGIKDAVIDNKSGVLVSAQDKDGFKKAVSRFLSDPKLAASFGAQARKYTIENYQWAGVAKRYLDIYERITS